MHAFAQISASSTVPWSRPGPRGEEDPVSEPVEPCQYAVLLVDEAAMTRECLAHMLRAGTSGLGVRSVARPEDATALSCPQLVLLNINSARIDDPSVVERVGALRLLFEDVPIVVVAHIDDGDMAVEAIRHDLRGYIPTSLDPDLMVAAIRLVLAGGIFVPENLIARYSRSPSAPDEPIVADRHAIHPFALSV